VGAYATTGIPEPLYKLICSDQNSELPKDGCRMNETANADECLEDFSILNVNE
jgi:hypothetical protein